MTVPFASIVLHKVVTTVGPYVGLASILAVAILILLYFAHARETATLRDRLDEAHQRIGGLEARIAQIMHAQAAAQRGRPGAPGPAPVAPAPVRPMGSAVSSVRRLPTPAPGAATAAGVTTAAGVAVAPGSAAAAVARAVAAGLTPAAPAGTAAPALASATKLIPDPETASTNGAPDDTLFVPAPVVAAAVAGNGHATSEQTAPLTAATQAIPAVAAASARTASASPRGGVAAPPRVQIGGDSAPPAAAAAAANPGAGAASGAGAGAGSGAGSSAERQGPSRRILPPNIAAAAPNRTGGRVSRLSGRVLPLLIGGIAVVVIIVGLVIITNTGGSSTVGNVTHNNGGGNDQTGESVSNQQHHHAPPPFRASKFTVSVLNGTAVSGLAGDVSTKLGGEGYRKGNATNAASQTQSSTLVYYITGANAKANRTAAQHVAKALTLPPSRVRPATQSAIQSCAISATGAALNSCDAEVIVSVGSDRANLASSAG